MRKIFYHPKKLKIMGMSDGETSMDFPFIVTEEDYHSTENLAVVKKGEKVILKVLG